MKKLNKKLLFYITAVLCLFFVFGKIKITSHAATGDLVSGLNFSATIKSFTNSNNVDGYTYDKTIKRIIFASAPAKPVASLQQKSVGEGVIAYYDSTDKTVYVCCATNKIRFNSESGRMFYHFEACEKIDFGTNIIDTTPMTDGSYFFNTCRSIKELDLSQFRTPSLKSMGQMFMYCENLEKINVSTLDTSQVTDMQSMFCGCAELATVDLSTFNTSKVDLMLQMFEDCKKLEVLDLSNFDTSNVTTFYRMFRRARKLEKVDVSSFRTPKVKDVKQMFDECKSLKYLNVSGFDLSNVPEEDIAYFLGECTSLEYIDAPSRMLRPLYYDANEKHVVYGADGKVALDDNKDGIPDTNERYDYFLPAITSHRYLFVDTIERVKKEQEEARKKAEEEAREKAAREQAEQQNNVPEGTPQGGAPQEGTAQGNTPGSSSSVSAKDIAISSGQITLPMSVTVNGVSYYINNQGQASVTKIGNVKSAKINSVTVAGTTYPVTDIKANACKGNKRIASLTIGSNVKNIEKNAFYKCKKLKNVKITSNKSLKIGKKAFKKLHKKAVIKIKGLKGNNKKKLINKLLKQTDAVVK